MKNLVLAGAAAGTVLLGGAAVANAQWALSYRQPWPDPYAAAYASGVAHCGFVTVRDYRNGRVVLHRLPRC
jgi:hypothetical protein